MYCSTCGNQLTEGLKFCNSCGMRLDQAETEERGNMVRSLSSAVAYISIIGVVAFLILVKLVIDSDLHPEQITFISGAFLATIFGICFLLIRQISKSSFSGEKKREKRRFFQKRIDAPDTKRLEESRQEPASVVENTTRTLGEVYSERK